MKKLIILATTLACLLAVGCDKDKDKKDDPTQTNTTPATSAATANTTTTPTPAATAATPVTISDTDLVTPADMEDEAATAITKKNYKTELTAIETEMGKE